MCIGCVPRNYRFRQDPKERWFLVLDYKNNRFNELLEEWQDNYRWEHAPGITQARETIEQEFEMIEDIEKVKFCYPEEEK